MSNINPYDFNYTKRNNFLLSSGVDNNEVLGESSFSMKEKENMNML